jgi:hypothetical protein
MEVVLGAYFLSHCNGVLIGGSMFVDGRRRGCKIWAVYKDKMGTAYILEILCRIQKPTFSVQVEMIIQNRSFPEPLSINHAEPSKTCNSEVFELRLPVYCSHRDHLWVPPVCDHTSSVFPYVKNEIVPFIIDDSAVKSFIVLALSSTQLTNKGFNLDWRIEVKGSDDWTKFCFQTCIVFPESEQEFLGSITSRLDAMRSMDSNPSLWIDDECRSWPPQGFDDHFPNTLSVKMFDDSVAVDWFWSNEANELILNCNVNVAAHHSSSCCSDGPDDEIISSGSGVELSIPRIAGRHV